MRAICEVEKTLFMRSPGKNVSVWADGCCLGPGLRREETCRESRSDDWYTHPRARHSEDNGATWSPWRTRHGENPEQSGCAMEAGTLATVWDPVARLTVRMIMRRITRGRGDEAIKSLFSNNEIRFCDHTFWMCSNDEGRTWSEPEMFRYENGPAFDASNWGHPGFFATNTMYGGYNCVALRDGRLAYAAVIPVRHVEPEDEAFVSVGICQPKPEHVNGVIVYLGRWNPGRSTYEWTASAPLVVPRRVSLRGLLEPALAELSNGRLMLSMRGSNSSVTPGRAWCCVSEDAGFRWGPVRDLCYDDRGRFYSPSAFSRLIRSGKTGRLYWIGNISDEPPRGNEPRYPLVIAEMDEKLVALKRDTVTVIATRDPARDSPSVQFSNFSVLENRQTFDMELYMTHFDPPALSERGADACHYRLKFCENEERAGL